MTDEGKRKLRECRWPGCQARRVDPENWGCKTHNARLPEHFRRPLQETEGYTSAYSEATLWAYNSHAIRKGAATQ